ncbi:O-antigen ligase family protein [Candidatus Bipolaricaulota bacterium]
MDALVMILVASLAWWLVLAQKWHLLLVLFVVSITMNYVTSYDILGISVTSQKIAGIAVLFPLVLASCINSPVKFKKTSVTLPFGFLILAVLASMFTASSVRTTLLQCISLVLIFMMIHVIYALFTASIAQRIKNTLIRLPIVFLLLNSGIIYQYLTSINRTLEGRVLGTFGNPNGVAAFTLMSLPLSITLLEDTKGARRLLGLICVSSSIGVLLLTFSRAGYLAGLVFGGIYLFTIGRRLRPRKAVALVLMLALSAFLLIHVIPDEAALFARDRFVSIAAGGGLNLDEPSIRNRVATISEALQRVRANPITGIGLGSFGLGVDGGQATENTYLQVLVGTGIIGLLAFMMIAVSLSVVLVRNSGLKDPYLRRLNRNLLIGFIMFAGLMVTNDFLLDVRSWFWVAVVVSLQTLDQNLAEQRG